MPAKKKTASDKSSRSTSAAKKSAVKKSAPKKAPAKKAARKSTASTASRKSSAAAAKNAGNTAAEQASPAAKEQSREAAGAEAAPKTKPTATELLKRTRHHTPSIFKVSPRKTAPIIFTLEDVREILKKRKVEEPEEKSESRPAAKETPKTEATAPSAAADVPVQKSKHEAASLADILGFGTGPATPKAAPQEKKVPKEFRNYYASLMELRTHVRESLGMHAEDTLKRSQKEDSGDISTSADAGTDNFDRDFALSVVSSEQEALREIEAAIQRIHNGTYGICEITGEKIASERLEAVPFTRFSLEGQRQYEATARRRVQRTGGFLSEGAADISFGDDDGDN